MKVRIEPHLYSRFEVIRQLRELIIAYNESKTSGEYQDTEYSFTDYLYSQSLDPVQRFLMLCIPKSSFPEEADYDQMITYWTMKFQTSRGTLKIFEYLREMEGILGVKIGRGNPGDDDYVAPFGYDTKTLEVNFIETETTDMNLFVAAGVEFFKALLYFQDLRDTYEVMRLDLTSDLYVNFSAGTQFYSTFTIEEDGI